MNGAGVDTAGSDAARTSGADAARSTGLVPLPDDAVPRALIDVSDPLRSLIVDLNVPGENAAAALGLDRGSTLDPLILADPDTQAEAGAKYDRLVAGEIPEYETFGTLVDVQGRPISLRFTVRFRNRTGADRRFVEVEWREVGLPRPTDLALDEEVLDVAQLITSGALAEAPIGAALVDVARNVYVTVNHAYAAIMGISRRELIERGTEVGRPRDATLAENAGEVMAVIRGAVDSVTMTMPVTDEPEVVDTVTIHAIGEHDRHTRYLLLYLLQRVRTKELPDLQHPVTSTPLPEGAYSRAVVDADWRLRYIEPPLEALGAERDITAGISVLPSVNPADIPSLLTNADLVRSGRADRTVVRARYRVRSPERGHLPTETEITRDAGLPEGWLILTNRMLGTDSPDSTPARLRAIAAAALTEDDGALTGSRDANVVAHAISEAHDLTPREAQILALIIDGSRVTTIARTLLLSDGTVRNYLSAIFRKVGVRNQAELIEFARATSRTLGRRHSDP
jgi:DNA-binding CsgD family transcriptional regulator/PAS domain-containing protein